MAADPQAVIPSFDGEQPLQNPYAGIVDRFHNWSARPSPGHGWSVLNGNIKVIASFMDKTQVDNVILQHNVDTRALLRYLSHEVGKVSRDGAAIIRRIEKEYVISS